MCFCTSAERSGEQVEFAKHSVTLLGLYEGADAVEATNKGIRVINNKVDPEWLVLCVHTKPMEPVSDGNFFT